MHTLKSILLAFVFILGAHIVTAQTPPVFFTTNITVGAQTMTVNFTNHPIRSTNFAVQVQQADGSWLAYDPGAPSTYLGTVVGQPGAIACATWLTNGYLWARIALEAGNEWVSFSGPSATAYVRGGTNYNFYNYPSSSIVTVPGGAGTNIYAAEIAVDSGWNHFNSCGQDLYRTVMAVEHSILSGDYLQLRDAGILHRIGGVYIRADYTLDPYHSISAAGGKLDACRVFLSSTNFTHDLGTVADSIGGGVAWVGSIGTGNRYSACGYNGGENGDFSQVWRHEVGHNWNCLDYEGGQAEGSTIMNGNSQSRYSGPEENKMVNLRNSKTSILENLGPYTYVLPPRASLDTAQLYYPGDVTIDVLKNDHSGNGLVISMLTSNATSLRGGTISNSPGTGPNGRDQLIYTPPTNNPTGLDKFAYRITDSAGRTAQGFVYVQVDPPVATPSPFDYAGNVPPSTDLSWTTFKPGSQYDIYFGADFAAVSAATTNSPLYRGRQLSLTNDPGLLAAAVTYYWRVDVVMTNGLLVPGTVWRFTTAASPPEANLLVHLTLDTAEISGATPETILDVAYPPNNFSSSLATLSQPGQIGESSSFGGSNSFLRSISSDIIPQSSGGTLSAWINTTNTSSGTYIVSVEGAWVLQYQAGGILAFLDGGSSGNGTFGASLNDGNWHHVLAANDGTMTRLYIDGTQAGSYAETIYNLASLSRQVGVGANYDGAGNFFTGSIDDVGIWARGLSAAEAYYVYTNGLAGKTVEKETILTRIGFEAAEGFTGYVSPNFAALGIKTDSFGAEWAGLAGDVQIWNRSDVPPSGVQCLKLGESNSDALCRVRFPGTNHGVGVVTFDYAAFSSSSDCDISLSYSNATSGGWVQVWGDHVSNSDPWWASKPWPTANVPIFVGGDMDLLLKKVGAKGVLLDNFRVTSKTDFPPVFAGNPLAKPGATSGVGYAGSIADDVYDPTPGDALTFSKLSGPAWLTVTANGTLSGMPSGSDYGANNFTVRVTDSTGKTGDATLTINVAVSATTLLAGAGPNSGYNKFWGWFPADNSTSPNGNGADTNSAVVTRWDDVRGSFDHDLARNSGGGGGIFLTNRINGYPAINYTGTRNNWGSYNTAGEFQTMPNGYTIFVVARINALPATAYLFDGASGNGRVALRITSGSPAKWQLQAVRTFNGSAINTTATTANVTTNVFQVHAVQVNGTNMTHYLNGALAGLGTFNDGGTPLPMSGLILACDAGVANNLSCDVAEVLTYNESLITADRNAIENYLLAKYALVLPPPSAPIITPSVSGGNLLMPVNSQTGYNYVLQSATNLVPPVVWTGIVTNAGTGGVLNFSAPVNPAQPQSYFRVVAY